MPGMVFETPDRAVASKLSDQILKAPPWKNYIDEADLFNIIWRAAYLGTIAYPNDVSGPLNQLDGGQAANRLISSISEALEEIPSAIEIFIPLNGIGDLQQAEITLTEKVSLIDNAHSEEVSAFLGAVKPSNDLFHMLGARRASGPTRRLRYLKVRETGLADDNADSQVMRSALAETKHLVFVALATGAFSLAFSSRRWDMRSNADDIPCLVVERKQKGPVVHGVAIPYDLSHFLQRLQFKEPLQVIDYQPGKGLLTSGMRAASNAAEVHQAVTGLLHTASRFSSLNSPDAVSIRAAMEWYVDSSATSNESVAFLQRCIGLEALLGSDGGRRDVTDRLADRYAYLLGKTESERGTLRRAFKGMYSHRSDVVHGRASKLLSAHKTASLESADMLLKCTWAEMHNVLKANTTLS